jgi:uncharacterized protein
MDIPIDALPIFMALVPVVAFLYASVGHGGASGYLALMALFSMSPSDMKTTSLLLNIFVAGIAFVQYQRGGHFRWRLFLPFAIASVPAAFLGGLMDVDETLYRRVLAVLLLVAVWRIVLWPSGREVAHAAPPQWAALLAGAGIGFFSGLIGIGGGILLSPLILLMGWGGLRGTAAVSALFIWMNSLAGMTGNLLSGKSITGDMWPLVVLAVGGGLAGAWYGSFRAADRPLTYLLAAVLVVAGGKLLFT